MPKKRSVEEVRGAEDEASNSSTSSYGPQTKRPRKASSLPYDTQEVCQELFETIRNHKTEDGHLLCEAFIKAPSKRNDPDYHTVVSQPMDMTTIQSRVRAEDYTDVEHFASDVELMINNAKSYYPMTSLEYQDACELQDLFTETKSVLLSEMLGGSVDPSLAVPLRLGLPQESPRDCDEDEEESEEQELTGHTAGESSMSLRERRYSYRDFLTLKISKRKIENAMKDEGRGEDEEESMYEELFQAAVMASNGNRCISHIFKVLPSRTTFPDYYEVIKDPIDLRTIARKMQQSVYTNLDQLTRDLLLMVHNAKTFNEPGSQVYKDAIFMKKLIQNKRHELEQPRATPRPVRSERIRSKKSGVPYQSVSHSVPAQP